MVEKWWRKRTTKINCDGVDGCLKLRSPAKIAFDMNACQPDNRIKIVLFYEYFKDPRSLFSGHIIQK